MYNIKEIGLALHTYHDIHKRLPPAVVTDKDGRPLYSWRVLILPFLEEGRLYKEFKLDEPWDGPNNLKLLERIPSVYRPPGKTAAPPNETHYQVFVGPGSAFERPGLRLKDFTDATDTTFLAVEATASVPWSKPADLTYDPSKPLPQLGGVFRRRRDFFLIHWHQEGFAAVFADGRARFIPNDTDDATLRALITRNGGEEVNPSDLE